LGCFNPSFTGKTHAHCKRITRLDGVYFSYHYSGLVKKAIKKIKYQGVFAITKELVDLSFSDFEWQQFQDFVIVPVPLHKKRQRMRGFNQAELIAEEIGKNNGLEVVNDALIRGINTKSQVDLQKGERRENIKGAFTVSDTAKMKRKKVLIIDDLFTTGSTLNECARVLKRSGVKEVWGLTIAHGN
jgi:competence protein ComFC